MSTITWAGGLPGSYNVTLGSNWVGGIAPGANDIADFSAAQAGPYNLLGNATWAEAQFEGDTATVKGTITASDSQSLELDIENAGVLTIAAGAAFLGSYNAQIGAAATTGYLADYGTISLGALDVYTMGTLGVAGTAALIGDINMAGGRLTALSGGGTLVSLSNAVHLLDNSTLAAAAGTTLALSGGIDGAYTLAVAAGVVALDAADSYTGGSTISFGATVLAGADDALGSSGAIILSGTLRGTQTETLHNALQIASQGLVAAASGTTLTLDGSATGGFFEFAGGITFGTSGDDGVVAIKIGGAGWGTPSFTIAGGTLRELNYGIIGGYNLSLAAGATLDLNGESDFAGTALGTGVITSEAAPGTYSFYGGAFAGTIAGQTSLAILGDTTLTGSEISSLGVSIWSGHTLQLGTGGGIGAFTAPGIGDDGLLLIDIGTAATIGSSISGAGSLAVTGTGPVMLAASNGYTGGTTIASGATLLAAADDALGSGTIVVSGALIGTQTETLHNQLRTSGNALLAAASGTTLTVDGSGASGVFNLAGGITFGTAGDDGVVALGLGGGAWNIPSFTIAYGTLRELDSGHIGGYSLSIAGGATLDISGITEYGGTVAGTGVIAAESAPGEYDFYTGTFAGTIAGQTTVDVLGAATLTGSDISSLGVSIWSGGTLQLGNGGSLGVFSAPSIIDTGLLLLDLGSGATLASSISGAGSVAVTGTGLVELDGSNAYTGGTTLGSGTLALGSGTALGVSGLIITGGTLLGETAATVGNAISLQGAAHIGATAGSTLNLGGLLSGFGNIIADTPGLLALEGANNYTGGTTLGTGAAVYAGNASALGVSDVLLTGNDRLIVGNASDLIETIDGFTVGDTIELAGFTVSSLSFSGGVLSAADSLGTTIDLNLSGVFAPGGFSFHNTSAGAEIVVCYLRGTRIATPEGEVEIEHLRRGDMVMTRKGARRIKWIGEQRYARRFLKDNRDMLPVCITAGALAEGVPARDLFVSPGHAMLLDGVLVLARDLVNGVTITQFWAPEEVHYFNIELNSHGCVLAEGAWAETYADCPGLRAKFHNAASFHDLFPEHVVPAAPRLCAPRVSAGASLAASLAPILARAAAETTPGRLRGYVERAGADGLITGWAQDEANPELPVTLEILRNGTLAGTVLAHEQRDDLRAAGIGPGRHGFRLKCPPGATVELRSRATGQPLPAIPRPARAGKRA
jgi:autotransporter-associated beta strand protein